MSGKIRTPEDFEDGDSRRNFPRFQGTNFRANLEDVDRVGEIAAEKGVTAGQVAIAWVMHRGEDVVPVPGTERVANLEQNAAAEVELTADDLGRLDEAMPVGATAGNATRSRRWGY